MSAFPVSKITCFEPHIIFQCTWAVRTVACLVSLCLPLAKKTSSVSSFSVTLHCCPECGWLFGVYWTLCRLRVLWLQWPQHIRHIFWDICDNHISHSVRFSFIWVTWNCSKVSFIHLKFFKTWQAQHFFPSKIVTKLLKLLMTCRKYTASSVVVALQVNTALRGGGQQQETLTNKEARDHREEI